MSGSDSIILDGTNEIYTVTDLNRKHHRLAAKLEPDEVAAGLNYFGVLVLADEYIDTNIADGTQWVLVVKQGELQKQIYCSNQFPIELQHFASWLDGKALGMFKVADSTLRPMLADAISREEYRRFSDEIWNAARRATEASNPDIPKNTR